MDIFSPALLASLAAIGTDQLQVHIIALIMIQYVIVAPSMQGVISGALRGAGKQVLGAVTNFICYYIIGLPIGICLALLANLGVMGMWIGIGIADTLQVIIATVNVLHNTVHFCFFHLIQTIAYIGYILGFNWKKLSDQVR